MKSKGIMGVHASTYGSLNLLLERTKVTMIIGEAQVYIYSCIHVGICTNRYTYKWTYLHIHVSVCMYIYIYVYIYMYIYIYTYL
jgi:hypothetical protein